MSRAVLAEAKAAWDRSYEGLGQVAIDQRVRGFSVLVRGIASRGSVSPEEFASETGVDVNAAANLFSELGTVGIQLDEAGNVVGAALTSRPTPHAVSVGGQKLFAWCALDTLFIPGLLDQVAEVTSTCPASGAEIQLSVGPDGVRSVTPPAAVVSVVLPGADAGPSETGPASPT